MGIYINNIGNAGFHSALRGVDAVRDENTSILSYYDRKTKTHTCQIVKWREE